MNVVSLFLSAAERYPDKLAIIDLKDSVAYKELAIDVETTAAYFKSKGIGEGDRVLVFVPMGIDLYRIVLALFYIGATAVFLDEWVSKKRLELCCDLADCKGFVGVFKARVFALFSKSLRNIPIKLNLKEKGTQRLALNNVPSELTALITFTTGSTGIPKAANRTHGFLNEQFKALLNEIEPKESDIDMPVLPIVLFMNLGVGCTSVIADFKMTKPNKMKPSAIIGQLSEHGVNRIIASPYFVKRLAQHVLNNNQDLKCLNKIFTGGAPVFPSEAKLYAEAFPNTESVIVYGSTEAEPISSISACELALLKASTAKGLPVGKPYHDIDIKIIKVQSKTLTNLSLSQLNELVVAPGEIGEIIVAGNHVLKQYFKNDQAFKENKIVVGDVIWHRTGDSGKLIDEQLYLTGRCKQLIKTEQGYLSPFIIEDQMQQLEGVEMGTLLSESGELLAVVESSLTKHELEALLSDISYDQLKVLDEIPRDPRHNSKIDYEKLKELVLFGG